MDSLPTFIQVVSYCCTTLSCLPAYLLPQPARLEKCRRLVPHIYGLAGSIDERMIGLNRRAFPNALMAAVPVPNKTRPCFDSVLSSSLFCTSKQHGNARNHNETLKHKHTQHKHFDPKVPFLKPTGHRFR